MKKAYFFLIAFGCWIFSAFCQPDNIALHRALDSVEKLLRADTRDTQQVKYMLSMASLSSQISLDSALSKGEKALQLSKEKKAGKSEAECLNFIAKVFMKKSDYKTALGYYELYLKKAQELGSKRKMADAYHGLGNMYLYMSDYPNAIRNYLSSVALNEETGNKRWRANDLANIGIVRMRQKSYAEAVKAYQEALSTYEALQDTTGITACLKNIGASLAEQGKFREALGYHLKSLKLEELSDKEDLTGSYNNIASVYLNLNEPDEALKYGKLSLELLNKKEDNFSKVYCLQGLAATYKVKKDLSKAKACADEAIRLAIQTGMQYELGDTYKIAGEISAEKRDFEGAYEYMQKLNKLKDSLFAQENGQAVAEMQAKYESEKKDKDLLKKDAEIRQQQAESREKALQRNGFIAGFVLMVLLAFFIFRSFRINKKASKSISEQKAIIEEKQKEILDSIHYARRIQRSLMASEKNIDKMLERLKKEGEES